jgi:hypothetical protein
MPELAGRKRRGERRRHRQLTLVIAATVGRSPAPMREH